MRKWIVRVALLTAVAVPAGIVFAERAEALSASMTTCEDKGCVEGSGTCAVIIYPDETVWCTKQKNDT